MDGIISAFLIGLGATLVMDIWSIIRKICFKIPYFNYGFVGRWVMHLPQGKFLHTNIANAPEIPTEILVGWFIHYLTGACFGALHIILWGANWLSEPHILQAIITGVVTVVFPFCLLMPCMGLGLAASKVAQPNQARIQSLITHSIFGLGLWLSAIALNFSS